MLEEYKKRKVLQINDFVHSAEISGANTFVVELGDVEKFISDLIDEMASMKCHKLYDYFINTGFDTWISSRMAKDITSDQFYSNLEKK